MIVNGYSKLFHSFGQLFCERTVLLWKIYFLVMLLIFCVLMYNTYDFMFMVSEQFQRYSSRHRRIYYGYNGDPPTALLKFQADLMLNFNDLNQYGHLKHSTFDWCPDLNGTKLTMSAYFDDASKVERVEPRCRQIFDGDDQAIKDARHWMSPCDLTDRQVADLSENCTDLTRIFRLDRSFYASELKASNFSIYPLAFVVLAGEKNAHQFYRLMNMIYRPWNAYCLTYDDDSSEDFKRSVKNFDKCFDNVAMPERFFRIKWASFTILESSMACLKILNDYDTFLPWRYVQFASWNDFPLRTMPEMVEIAKILNGSLDVELTRGQIERYGRYHVEASLDPVKKGQVKPVPPGDLVVYKGSMATMLSREFVRFVFSNAVAIHFFEWCRTTFAAEEQYWSTLVHNLHLNAPGAFTAACLPYYELKRQSRNKPFVSRYQVWYRGCAGKLTSGSCVFGIGDLSKLTRRPEIFAHKFYLNFQPAAYYCMSKWYAERSKRPYLENVTLKSSAGVSTTSQLNSSYELSLKQHEYEDVIDWSNSDSKDFLFRREFYENLPGVRYHKMADKSNFTC